MHKIALAISLFLGTSTQFSIFASDITLEDIFIRTAYFPVRIEAKPIQNEPAFTYLYNYRDIIKSSFVDRSDSSVILSSSWLYKDSVYYFLDYEISDDGRYLLFSTDFEPRFRHSAFCRFYLWDLEKKILQPLNNGKKMLHADISPDSRHIAFVYENNIYLYHIENRKITTITTDGAPNAIINGSPDWLYEEEFALVHGFEWSPSGDALAYYRFDETNVKDWVLQKYSGVYPEVTTYKYPKAGEFNAQVQVKIFNLGDSSTLTLPLDAKADHYVPRIHWTPWKDTLLLVKLNRLQNHLQLMLANTNEVRISVLYEEKVETYIPQPDNPFAVFDKINKQVIFTSSKDGYKQLYACHVKNGYVKKLTDEQCDVNQMLYFNEASQHLYFSSFKASPIENHVYALDLASGETDQLSDREGWNNAFFSRKTNDYAIWHSSADVADNFSIHDGNTYRKWTFINNMEVEKAKQHFGFRPKEFFTVDTKNGVFNAYLIKPAQMQKNRKYPVLIYVYGGPGSQKVANRWDGYRDEWFQVLANKGYIVACMDGRGTGGRGTAFEHDVYKQLGKLETGDQIDFAKYLGKMPYVDKGRIGIFGWSYGGYLALLCLEKGNKVFKTGISVAPITHWKYYDTGFTERFMQRPEDNEEGYRESSPLEYVGDLKAPFMLVHGLHDDNVHFQHTAEMIKALIENDKDFELLALPDNNHNLNEGKTLLYLYRKMTEYIINNL
jgi:dipeptidyl-peptidase 4